MPKQCSFTAPNLQACVKIPVQSLPMHPAIVQGDNGPLTPLLTPGSVGRLLQAESSVVQAKSPIRLLPVVASTPRKLATPVVPAATGLVTE